MSKTWAFYKNHSWKFGVLTLVVLLLFYSIPKIEFNINSEETYGKVYDIKRIVTGSRIGPLYKYKFWFIYEEKKHFGESLKTPNVKIEKGEIFKVKFSPNDPNINEILFDQVYVEKFSIGKNGNKKTFYFKKK